MNPRQLCLWISLSVLALASGPAGSDDKPAAPPPEVEVVQPESREVSDHEDFTGRTEASAAVVIAARVSGYLDRVLFKDGAPVKKGDLLFEIDPRPYKAELDKAAAALALSETRLRKAEAAARRARALFDRKAISQEEYDLTVADLQEARARVALARASHEVARLNLSFTRVVAPISGRISRRLLDPGNLVKADETGLATLVCTGPMYVYFDIDERTALRLRRVMSKGKGQGPRVAVALADEKGFPRRAAVDYVGNRLDPKAGTLRLRATLPNADGLLLPGLFVRARLTTGEPYKALLVPGRAVGRNGEQAFVLVVNRKDEVEVRKVRLGSRQGNLAVVKEGLTATDWVVLRGPQGLRAGMTVRPKKVAVPGGQK
jgi:membrane fusion protein, multidrug efflux system